MNPLLQYQAALIALSEAKENMQQPKLVHAVDWLLSKQNIDGGWGETTDSYADEKLKGIGLSSISQTSIL